MEHYYFLEVVKSLPFRTIIEYKIVIKGTVEFILTKSMKAYNNLFNIFYGIQCFVLGSGAF